MNRQPFANLITLTRSSTATYFGADGLLKTAAVDEPRIEYNPVTGECIGLLIEESRQNALLNSETLSTQSVSVTASARTLSFYGTGTVTLSGAYAGSLAGSGAFPQRSSLTFTPAAGTLTLTVSGTVSFAQLETGSFPTSYIPTTSAAVTRSADVAVMNTLAPWYKSTGGTLVCRGRTYNAPSTLSGSLGNAIATMSDGSSNNRIRMLRSGSNTAQAIVVTAGTSVASVTSGGWSSGESVMLALAFTANDFRVLSSGGAVSSDTSGEIPALNKLYPGSNNGTAGFWNGHIQSIRYYDYAMSNAELQAITA